LRPSRGKLCARNSRSRSRIPTERFAERKRSVISDLDPPTGGERTYNSKIFPSENFDLGPPSRAREGGGAPPPSGGVGTLPLWGESEFASLTGRRNWRPPTREGRPREGRPREGRPREGRPREGRPREGRPREGRPREGRPREGRPRPARGGGLPRPARGGGLPRPWRDGSDPIPSASLTGLPREGRKPVRDANP